MVERGSKLTGEDIFLFNEGTHYRLYDKLGAHECIEDGARGVRFSVWAPDAVEVSVIGDFNGWDHTRHHMKPCASSGIWSTFVPGVREGERYKYRIISRQGGAALEKSDPFAFRAEVSPANASVVWGLDFDWTDAEWMRSRGQVNSLSAPISIYELHLGSWRRAEVGAPDGSVTYRGLAASLPKYVKSLGFTHVEFLPVMEHPFYGSWGYQVTGYYAPTGRYGSPQDFMYMIDELHRAGIGVILDWVPSHFPTDAHGLALFDGTSLFEHADPRQGFHPDWKSAVFNYGRNEVRSFLISSALFWLDRYHADGLRVDGVASMLYLDYSRKEGEWVPNKFGGRENLEAIGFLRALNGAVQSNHSDVQVFAEESTAWPKVTRTVDEGGLGFGLKWDMGWMHDTLKFMGMDPVHRRFQHEKLTFRMLYAFQENFVLSLSHDEVVHGKGSLFGRMPGDEWRKFAQLRLLFALMTAQPGKKLLFMGGEFGQPGEWNHDRALEWEVLAGPHHRELVLCVSELNHLYRSEDALHSRDCVAGGFEWIEPDDSENSVISWLRWGEKSGAPVLFVGNFTPVAREIYRIGVPFDGAWNELFNSDADEFGGSGVGNLGRVMAEATPSHGRPFSLRLRLPPFGALFLKPGARRL